MLTRQPPWRPLTKRGRSRYCGHGSPDISVMDGSGEPFFLGPFNMCIVFKSGRPQGTIAGSKLCTASLSFPTTYVYFGIVKVYGSDQFLYRRFYGSARPQPFPRASSDIPKLIKMFSTFNKGRRNLLPGRYPLPAPRVTPDRLSFDPDRSKS